MVIWPAMMAPRYIRLARAAGCLLSAAAGVLALEAPGQLITPFSLPPQEDALPAATSHEASRLRVAPVPTLGPAEPPKPHGGLLVPSVRPDWRVYAREIDNALEDGDLDGAAAAVRDALAVLPDNPDFLARAGHIFTAREEFFIAEDYWEQLGAQMPSNSWVLACWGGLLVRVERRPQAKQVLESSLRINPQEPVARFNLTCLSVAEGDADPGRHVRGSSTADVGRYAAWARDDAELLSRLFSPGGYRRICDLLVSAGESEGKAAEAGAPDTGNLPARLNEIANRLWEATQAIERKDWPTAVVELERARAAGATAPAIERDIEECRRRSADKTPEMGSPSPAPSTP